MRGFIEDITVEKIIQNTFERGNLLFDKINISKAKSSSNDLEIVKRIVKEIRYSDKVFLVLKDTYLSSQIRDELIWVFGQNETISLITADEDIAELYSSITSNIVVDGNVSCNAIIIEKDEITASYILENHYYPVAGDEIYRNYFLKEKFSYSISSVLDKLKVAEKVYVFNSGKLDEKLINQVLVHANNLKIESTLIINATDYNIDLYNSFCKNKSNLVIFNKIHDMNCILYEEDFKFYMLKIINGLVIPIEICGDEYNSLFPDGVFKLSKLPIKIEVSKMCNNKYLLKKNGFEPYLVKEGIKIENTIMANSFEEYLSQTFDTSFYNSHNDYCDYKEVQYITKLQPPLLPKTAIVTANYETINEIAKKIVSIYKSYADKISEGKSVLNNDSWKGSYLEKLNFQIDECIKLLSIEQGRDLEQDICLDIMKSIKIWSIFFINKSIEQTVGLFASRTSGEYNEKTNRIKDEIEQKKELIKVNEEKLIDANENHSRAQRRIENLNEEIAVLEKLLEKQNSNISDLLQFDKNAYVIRMTNFLNNVTSPYTEEPSTDLENNSFSRVIGNSSTINSETKVLEKKVFLYTQKLQSIIISIVELYDLLIKMDLPKASIMFEENEIKYLAIKDWGQVMKAKEEAIKYQAKLVVER